MKNSRTTFVSVMVLAFAGVWAMNRTEASPKDEEKSQAVPKLVAWAGSYSAIETRRTLRITDTKAWTDLWKEHMGSAVEHDSYGEPVVPAVDFNACMVIAFFDGKTQNVRSIAIDHVDEFADHLRIRYDERSYQTETFSEPIVLKPGETPEDVLKRKLQEPPKAAAEDDPNRTKPYGMFVLPRSKKPIDFEENVQTLMDPAPIWEHRQRMKALPN